MKKFISLNLFLSAGALALTVYGLTQPIGIPWGVVPHFPSTWLLASLGAGLLAALVCSHLGWRFAAAAALVWIFLPPVWNGVVLGSSFGFAAALGAIGLWVLDVVFRIVFSEVIRMQKAARRAGRGAFAGVKGERRHARGLRRIGWVLLVGAVLFAAFSLIRHDYRLGSAATAYAREIVREANGRIIVLNGICDEQMKREIGKTDSGQPWRFILPSAVDADYREHLLGWTRKEWPAETNLAIAAQIGVMAFLDVAMTAHPERFFAMNATETSLEEWTKRWEAFRPYLSSRDRFVRIARRIFAYAANGIANKLQTAGQAASPLPNSSALFTAWELYWRVVDEVDPGNISALVNLSEMARRGYAATEDEKTKIEEKLAEFFSDRRNRHNLRAIVRASGPVKTDPDLLDRYVAENRQRVAAALAAGQKLELSAEAKDLLDWNNTMVRAADQGNTVTAGRFARKILNVPRWRGFVPANAVMGAVMAKAGDYVASESFYRAATASSGKTPAVVWNDFADTLMHLGKLDEAERILREHLKDAGGETELLKLTLSEVLEKKKESAP